MKRTLTTGVIAKELRCPLWRVQYLLKSRKIKEKYRVGHFRVYSENVIKILRKELGEQNQETRVAEKRTILAQ